MSGQEIEFVKEAFASNWIAPCGPNQEAFEQEMAEYIGAKGAVALVSGTAAIHLALRLCGVGPGDVVFCSSLTFIGSATPILFHRFRTRVLEHVTLRFGAGLQTGRVQR